MLIQQVKFYKFSIASLLQPAYNPYWPCYGSEQLVKKSEVLENLLQTAVQILTQDNTEIIKQYKKDIKQQKQLKHNIEFENNIEWSLLEHLLMLRTELDNSKFKFIFEQNNQTKPIWKILGQLEVYGVSPYRHQNHYIHEYNHKTFEEKVEFSVKPQLEQKSDIEDKQEKLAKPILDSLDKEKQDHLGLFGRARMFINKVNKVVTNEKAHEQQINPFQWKKYILQPSKGDRILVRDYELEFEGILTIKDQNNQYLQEIKFVDSILPKQNKIYLRTEAWMEAKESLSTSQSKRQVLTDINFVLRGNPWVWVKKFDEEEEEEN